MANVSFMADNAVMGFAGNIASDSVGQPFSISSLSSLFPVSPIPPQPTCQKCFKHCPTNFSGYCNACFSLMQAPRLPPHAGASVQPFLHRTMTPSVHNNTNYPCPTNEHDISDSFIMTNMLNVVDDVLREDSRPVETPNTTTTHSSMHSLPGNIAASMHSCNRCGTQKSKLVFCPEYTETLCISCLSPAPNLPFPITSEHHIPTTKSTSPKILSTHSSVSSTASYFSDCGGNQDEPEPLVNVADCNNLSGLCTNHPNERICYFCQTCTSLICYRCISDGHQHHSHTTIKEAYERLAPAMADITSDVAQKVNHLDISIEAGLRMREMILRKKENAVQQVQLLFQSYREALARQEKEILGQISGLSDLRLKSLSKEKESREKLVTDLKGLQKSMSRGNTDPGNKAKSLMLFHSVTKHMDESGRFPSTPLEDDSFIVKSVNHNVQELLKPLCIVTTAPYPPMCSAMGEGLFHPRVNRITTVLIVTKDRTGEPCIEGGERISVSLRSINMSGSLVKVDLLDNQDGSYTISFRPKVKGEHVLGILIRGHHIKGSPFKLDIDGGREYNSHLGVASIMFGSEGSQEGQFCRPWGIACDQNGNIIVGDRSNHRIQVFDSNGVVKTVFGSMGPLEGQFNRPAGVATTREGHIVVADKDNHRIQIFTIDGKFLRKFGNKGGNDGQMIYPYDVAVSQMDGRIAVTDTGNHRLLIFSRDGMLMGKFGYKGYLCGHFDSPRGIAFNDEGHIIVSDFNVHHILVIHPDGTTARILGSQGVGNGQFLRPQGIGIDHLGNFVIADTRNSRIVIMHPNGHFKAKFGSPGSGQGQLDRPTSVCVLPDGRIAVVDFGNSRVQIF